MKRSLLLFLVLLMGICVVYSLEYKNRTALTLKTTDPLATSVMCNEIDSVTFSKMDINGVLHDSIVTQLVHTPDSVLVFPIDSIYNVSFTDEAVNMEIFHNYKDLSSYLDGIGATQMDSVTVVSKILSWLNKQETVVSAALIENNSGIEIAYSHGGTGYITFEQIEDIPEIGEPIYSLGYEQVHPSTRSSEPVYHNISAIEGEEILNNTKFLFFRGVHDPVLWLANGSYVYEETIEKMSPISGSMISTEVCLLGELLYRIKECSVCIITNTHGNQLGWFMVDYSPYYLKELSEDLLQAAQAVFFKGEKYEFSLPIAWVKPKLFDQHETGDGVGVLSYCWSDPMRSYLDSKVKGSNNEVKHKNFAAQATKTQATGNRLRANSYLSYLCKGYTHLEAIKNANKYMTTVTAEERNDDQFFTENDENNNPLDYAPKRFFSIKNRTDFTKYSPEYAIIYCMVKGWTNLKHEETKNFKIWYKDEPFEHPDETCKVHEFEVVPGNQYTSRLLDDDLVYTDNGPNVMVFNTIEGEDGIFTYYTMGFEHNDEIYHGPVDSLICIAKGVTEGEWIDMGLPSGTIWASSDFAGVNNSKYDILVELSSMGNLPSRTQFEELLSDENTFKVPLNKQWIRLVSKHNGNRMDFFLPGHNRRYIMDGTRLIESDNDSYFIYNVFWCNGFPTENHIMKYEDCEFEFTQLTHAKYAAGLNNFSHFARFVK